jgi:DNA-binding response OmpR family regulator
MMTKRILHIDCNIESQTLVKDLLEPHGYDIVSASSGKDGILRMKEESFDLVILEVVLQEVTGWDILETMRGMFYPAKVVFYSIMPLSETELPQLKEAGISDYIHKPASREDFIRRIRDVLEPRKNILHVEDDEDTSILVKRILDWRGYNVISVSRGDECLRRLKGDIDLVLLDVMLPDMSGWTIFQEIRKDPGNSSLKVAFLSIMPVSKSQMEKLQEVGVVDYITKPFDNVDLIRRVDKAVWSDAV